MLERALELAERGRGTTYPNPVVGAVVARGDEIVGEGWHQRKGGPHGEVVALEAAGEGARGATMYVTLEPCDHHGTTPPCVDAILAAGIAKVVVGVKDPTRDGIARLRESGVEVELVDLWAARVQNEAWLTWARLGRPFVTYKAAVTLDGRVTVPGKRWVSGEESRRLVHELRAASDAERGLGGDGVRPGEAFLDHVARHSGGDARRAFGRGPLPEGSELELLSGELEEELGRLAGQDVQSLLLESGPTLAAAFLEADLVDKLMLFVAPTISGEGPGLFASPPAMLTHQTARRVGDDVLLTAYVHEP